MDKLKMAGAMTIFGTIGLFIKYIGLPSSVISLARGFIGTIFIFLFVKIKGVKISKESIKANGAKLIISGIFIGFNWILLFESYRYTTVTTATLCYYLAPVFVLIVSPFVLKEKMTPIKAICILIAFGGMILVSGVLEGSGIGSNDGLGIALGCGAAVLYAIVILINRFIKNISAYDKTMIQLLSAAVIMIPYILITEDLGQIALEPMGLGLLMLVGIVHTGLAYTLYFGSMDGLKTQTVALFSYLDPIVAIIVSALILQEKVSILTAIGAIMVLGSTFISEFSIYFRARKDS